tara:strand:+ start:4614 stop:5399 length:786 start_codon:yes stop_codon:yes gene_type:complete
MIIEFSKYNGAGNDFIVVDDRNDNIDGNKSLIKKICDRNFGVGGDGLILIKKSMESDFKIVHYTPDGKIGSLCGNGSRCGVSFAFKNNLISKNTVFTAYDGIHKAEIISDELIKMEMKINSEILENEYGVWLDTGSPHLIVEQDNTDLIDVKKEGRLIRYNNLYKEEGVNVNFVEKISDNTFKIRTYERGVENETLACGTGSTATAICMNYMNKSNSDEILMKCRGGDLRVKFNVEKKEFSNISITGPANFVFKGKIDLKI